MCYSDRFWHSSVFHYRKSWFKWLTKEHISPLIYYNMHNSQNNMISSLLACFHFFQHFTTIVRIKRLSQTKLLNTQLTFSIGRLCTSKRQRLRIYLTLISLNYQCYRLLALSDALELQEISSLSRILICSLRSVLVLWPEYKMIKMQSASYKGLWEIIIKHYKELTWYEYFIFKLYLIIMYQIFSVISCKRPEFTSSKS